MVDNPNIEALKGALLFPQYSSLFFCSGFGGLFLGLILPSIKDNSEKGIALPTSSFFYRIVRKRSIFLL
jgi:hypothetical protein